MKAFDTKGRRNLAQAGLIVAIVLPAAIPLFINGQILATRSAGDSPFLLIRLYELALNLRHSVVPARWMPDGAFGLGYPFFNFYACLPYYLAAFFHFLGLGYLWPIKLTQAFGLLFAASAMYLYARELLKNQSRALLAAVAYTYAPFHLVNIYLRGDSLSEFYAFVFYPLILWALERLAKRRRLPDVASLALSYGALVMTHNISAFLFTPWALLYILVILVKYPDARPKVLALSLGGLALGLALSAWFWIPALGEQSFVQMEELTQGYFHYSNHFRGRDLVEMRPLFPYQVEESMSPPFKMGLVQVLLLLGGLAMLSWRAIRRKSVAPQQVFILALLLASTFLITPLSRPIWDRLPLLPLVQFPWRLLSVQALAVGLLTAELLPSEVRLKRSQTKLILASLAMMAASLLGLRPEYLHIKDAEVTRENISLYEYLSGNIGSTVNGEYLPRWVSPPPQTSSIFLERGAKTPPLAAAGELAETTLLWRRPTAEEWKVVVASPQSELLFPTYYFPGWQAYVDGIRVPIQPKEGLGYITVQVPQGEHRIGLRFGRTPLRTLAEGLSLAAVFASLVFLVGQPVKREAILRWSIGAGLILGTIWGLARLLPKPQPSSLSYSDTTLDLRALYPHHNPGGIRFGRDVRLLGYYIEPRIPQAGEEVRVTLFWKGTASAPLTVTLELVSHGDIFFQPGIFSQAEGQIIGDETLLEMALPHELNRGIYLLRVSLVSSEGRLQAFSNGGSDLGRLYLAPLWVDSASPQEKVLPPLGNIAPGVELMGMESAQEADGTLGVQLTWRTTKPLLENLKVSVRLLDPAGRVLSSHDAQPDGGSYPTSLWRVGELTYDHHRFLVPRGTPPGSDYALEVVLYRAQGMEEVGKLRIPGLQLAIVSLAESPSILSTWEGEIALSSIEGIPPSIKAGHKLPATLYWWARQAPSRDHQVALWLEDDKAGRWAELHAPLAGGYPTSHWPAKALVRTSYELTIPKDLVAGKYRLCLALDDGPTPWCVPFRVGVLAQERQFQPPSMAKSLGADFDSQVTLLGYDWEQGENTLAITLHWQAREEMAQDYKVFVHLFDPTTEKILLQHDGFPRGGEYPTSQWAGGEVVSEKIELSLEGVPAGQYRLVVGLYDPQTMKRLSAEGPTGVAISEGRVVLAEEIIVD